MNIRIQSGLILLAACGLLTAATANAAVILGNFDNDTGVSTPAFATTSINRRQHKGVLFTLNDRVEIDALYLALPNFNDDDNYAITIRMGDINGGIVASFDQVNPTPGLSNDALTWMLDSSNQILLDPGTYAIDLREAANTYTWSRATSQNISPTGIATFGGYQFEDNNGIIESQTFNSFRLTGNAVPIPGVTWLMSLPLLLLTLGRGSIFGIQRRVEG